MKKKIILVVCFILAFLLGACSTSKVSAEQTWPLKIWKQNDNSTVSTYCVIDDDTGVNYVVVTAMTYSNAKTIAITPRFNADGSLYVSD